MQYYFVEKSANEFVFDSQDQIHIKKVMRMKINDKIICIYHQEKFLCSILKLNPTIKVKIINPIVEDSENKVDITLIIGIIKRDKWNFVLQKATELGVNKIIPFYFQHSNVQIPLKVIDNKIARWNLICKEAAEQSHRNKIPTILKVKTDLKDIKSHLSEFNLLCYTKSKNQLSKILPKKLNNITVIIGSEGGISKDEYKEIINMGFDNAKISNRILRSETAAMHILSILDFCYE